MFKKVTPKLDLPKEEEKILALWEKEKTFEKTLAKKESLGNFVFYEGPPTANGKPGLHHVLARAFKDLYARYKTMQGYHVTRKAGWDTHGLPVELQVEKELGISGKQEIENIVKGNKAASIEKFNKLCQESVWRYKGQWEEMTKRMGYWVDLKDPYITYRPEYIESVWWAIGEIDKKGLLYKSHKVAPYCPRCGTTLSSHEVAQGYKEIKEESIYVLAKSEKENLYFVVWTTTPWTLSGNSALAFGENIKYVLANVSGKKYIIAKSRADECLSKGFRVEKEFSGKELVETYGQDGASDYHPLYEDGEAFSEAGDKAYKLILADYVTDKDGSGIVHIAPAFGQEDYDWGFQKNRIKVLKTVDERGTLLAGAGKGQFVKKADNEIKTDLEKRGLLLKRETVTHDYPFCWRCDSPLLYYARDSWYVATTKVARDLIKNNDKINWKPNHLKKGRFGNWLEGNIDWALSRDRYWGTPLPVWECQTCKKYRVVTSLAEVGKIEPHRPFIDEVTFDCDCGGKMKRAPEVIDVWFDSGSMPYAQYHYPFENKELFQSQFPADYICEAVDQTRGWFYTLLAISTMISNIPSYKNVISTGHVLDGRGQKMSKSKGNIVVPDEAFDKFGADVIRFFFYSVNKPEEPKLFIEKEVLAVSRNLFLTLWNVYSFFVTYAEIDKFVPSGKLESDNVLDQWIQSKLNKLIGEVTKNLDHYEPYSAAILLMEFTNELSTWYVRRSRRRFWKSENDTDKSSAYETLYFVLKKLSILLAPFAPMYAELIYQGLRLEGDEDSVHLAEYPKAKSFDKEILSEMERVRKIVETGLSERMNAGIKVRQPLAELSYPGQKLEKQFEEIIADEVNVKKIINKKETKKVTLETVLTKELISEGLAREVVRKIQDARKKAGFEIADRIELNFETKDKDLAEVIEKTWNGYITKETLATKVEPGKRAKLDYNEEATINDIPMWVGLTRVK